MANNNRATPRGWFSYALFSGKNIPQKAQKIFHEGGGAN
jgi:hypothetical protein